MTLLHKTMVLSPIIPLLRVLSILALTRSVHIRHYFNGHPQRQCGSHGRRLVGPHGLCRNFLIGLIYSHVGDPFPPHRSPKSSTAAGRDPGPALGRHATIYWHFFCPPTPCQQSLPKQLTPQHPNVCGIDAVGGLLMPGNFWTLKFQKVPLSTIYKVGTVGPTNPTRL